MNQLRLFLFASCLFLFSCSTPSPVEVVRTFENYENFNFSTNNTEIEFVKDSTEFIKYIGNADYDPVSIFKIEERIYGSGLFSYAYLNIRGYSYLDNVILNKIEIHYKHVRRFGEMFNQSSGSYGSVFYQNSIYTREPIQEDSIDITLINQQDSVIEVNTDYLKVTGWATTRLKLAGNTHYFNASISAAGPSLGHPFVLNFGDLITDSSFVNVYFQNNYNHLPYVRIDVQANNLLDIKTGSLIGTNSDCPTCICEIYYKGHPTILNRDSLDSRVVIIDNN